MMHEPRRILHVVHGYPPESRGGTETYVASLLASQVELGLEPALLHGSFEPRPEPVLEARDDLDVPAFRLHRADSFADYWDKAHDPAAGALFRGLLGRVRPDLVHVHQWIRLSDDLVRLSESCGIPVVVSLHDVYASCPSCFRLRPDDSHCDRVVSFESCHDCVPLRGHESREEVALGIDVYRASFRGELLGARRVLAATHATAKLVTAGLGLPETLVHVLPLGYEPRFDGLPRTRAGGAVVAAFWGNITHRKGTQVLLRALRALDDASPLAGRLELHLFGKVDTAELDAELHSLADGLPVVFHGRFDYADLARVGMRLAVFPSTCFETYGFVLDEAFELGVPALVTDVGAFAERLSGAGFLVRPGDAGDLAVTLGSILDDPHRLEAAAGNIPRASPKPVEHARLLAEHYGRAAAARPGAAGSLDSRMRDRLSALRGAGDRDTEPCRRGLP